MLKIIYRVKLKIYNSYKYLNRMHTSSNQNNGKYISDTFLATLKLKKKSKKNRTKIAILKFSYVILSSLISLVLICMRLFACIKVPVNGSK